MRGCELQSWLGCTYIPPKGEDIPLQGDLYYPLSCLQKVIEIFNLFSGIPMGDRALSSKFGSWLSFL